MSTADTEMAGKIVDCLERALERVPQWTAVSPETTPEVGRDILAFCISDRGVGYVVCAHVGSFSWSSTPGGWNIRGRATHWMYLPAPPESP